MSFHPLLKKCWRPKKHFRNGNWNGEQGTDRCLLDSAVDPWFPRLQPNNHLPGQGKCQRRDIGSPGFGVEICGGEISRILTESGRDALSIAQIDQCAQTHHADKTLPNPEALVLAQDGDEAGDRQAEAIRKAVLLHDGVRSKRRRSPDYMNRVDIVTA